MFRSRHFLSSIELKAQPVKSPHRTQDRITETYPEKIGTYYDAGFKNEPNTDWSLAARDQAISNIIYSAFGNSGQKCSATSLLILEHAVYRDAGFRKHLVDAACSVATGSAWDFANKIA